MVSLHKAMQHLRTVAMPWAFAIMTQRHKKLKELLKEIEEVNWRLIREGLELRDYGTV